MAGFFRSKHTSLTLIINFFQECCLYPSHSKHPLLNAWIQYQAVHPKLIIYTAPWILACHLPQQYQRPSQKSSKNLCCNSVLYIANAIYDFMDNAILSFKCVLPLLLSVFMLRIVFPHTATIVASATIFPSKVKNCP